MQKKTKQWCVVVALLSAVAGIGIGLFLGDCDGDVSFNEIAVQWLVENTNTAATDRKSDDLTAIWIALAPSSRDMLAEIGKRPFAAQLSEGLVVSRHTGNRLAPVMRGILEAKNCSVADYLRLEATLYRWCVREGNDQRTGYFQSRWAGREAIINTILGKPSHELELQRQFDAAKEEVITALNITYPTVAAFDDWLFEEWVHFNLKAKGKEPRSTGME